jgi:hypothetical protein
LGTRYGAGATPRRQSCCPALPPATVPIGCSRCSWPAGAFRALWTIAHVRQSSEQLRARHDGQPAGPRLPQHSRVLHIRVVPSQYDRHGGLASGRCGCAVALSGDGVHGLRLDRRGRSTGLALRTGHRELGSSPNVANCYRRKREPQISGCVIGAGFATTRAHAGWGLRSLLTPGFAPFRMRSS